MVARLDGDPSHETVQRAVLALENLEHRGAAGADPNTGDGAGMLLQLPDELLRAVIRTDLPPPGQYGVAVCFLPQDDERRAELEALLTSTVEAEGQRVVGWRDVPVDKDYVGITANYFAPYIKQLVVAAATPDCLEDQDAFERRLYVIRRVAELAAGPDLVVPSFSSRTIVYKGMLTAPQLLGYYPDLQDQRAKTRARARPLALLDQHVPELGAGAPLPLHRPQRRDQHAARQRQLDARPRVPARLRAVRRRATSRSCCRSSAPAARTRRRSTTCSSCSCSRAARCRTR